MLVFVEGGKPENPKKNTRSRKRTNNKLNPHMTAGLGIKPGPHWWETSVLTTAPNLYPVEETISGFSKIFFETLGEFPSYFIQSQTMTSAHEYSERNRANIWHEHRDLSSVSDDGSLVPWRSCSVKPGSYCEQ